MPTILRKCRAGTLNCFVSVSALAFMLAGSTRTIAQDPVSFDGSRSKEMEVVWVRQTGVTGMGAYMQNVADIPGNNIVTVLTNNVYRTWPTTPTLDTTATGVEWIGGRASKFTMPIDYDGIPPMEISSNEYVFRPSLDGRIMTAIDTVCLSRQGASSDVNPRWASDVNGDGQLDVVSTNLSSPNYWFAVLLSGAGRGEGCERTVIFPNVYSVRPSPERPAIPLRMMRCADGKLRIVYVGSIHEFRSGIYLLDVNLQQTDTGYVVSYTMADSVEQRYMHLTGVDDPWIVQSVGAIDDAKSSHQYALVNWQDGYHRNHNTTVMYEVSNGKFVERISTKGVMLSPGLTAFENTFDDGPAVIAYGGGGFTQFARIAEFYRPFAKVKGPILGSGWSFIDDQFNDGSRDFLTASQYNGTIQLVNFDLRPTGVQVGEDHEQTWAQLNSGRLRLTLDRPSNITVDVVNAIGQKQPINGGFQAPAGPSVLDITPQLQALPKGAWFVRVSDGVRVVSLSYLR